MNPITFNFTGAIQNYTVSVTGTYDLLGFGAGGGAGSNGASTGGSGAEVGATFNLVQGQQLQIIVGGVGTQGREGGGGGGFTEILANSGAGTTYTPILIAGGGGGGGRSVTGQSTAAGLNAQANPVGATLGAGGAAGTSTSTSNPGGGGGGGAGATSDGGSSVTANGGLTSPTYTGGGSRISNGTGGFGGGGGGGYYYGGGGGGGGNTGGVGGNAYGSGSYVNGAGGGGGTSYLAAAGTLNAAETRDGAGISTSNGSVRINLVTAAPAPTPTPAPSAAPAASPVPCYVTGTRIRVLRGVTIDDVSVERLCVGDLAITAAGKPRPIRWIGSRGYAGLTAPKADCPVRIKTGALADGVPVRDLLVSPDHCLMIDGLFVAAGHLVNGTSITRGEAVRDLTYWHVELDSHDLLVAENTPAESFLAAPGVRAGFTGVQALDAGAAPVPYASRTELGPELAALRGRLARRAISSGEAAALGPVRAWLDRCAVGADGTLHVAGWAQDAAQPDVPVCLDVMVDGAVVAFTVASEYRADLATAGVGDGRVGFDLGLNVRLAPGALHVIEVRRSADGALVCAKQVDAAGAWTALLAA